MTDAPEFDLTVTRLNTLQFVIGQSLSKLKADICNAPDIHATTKIRLESQLVNLTHLVGMADEIADALEPALRGVVRTVNDQLSKERIDRVCAHEIFSNFNTNMGDFAADQLITDALGT